MSYNQILKEESRVVNHEGAKVYKLSPEMELYTLVCTMALSRKFYELPSEQIDRLSSLIAKVDARFVAKLAVYARREMHIRSVPLLLVVELARVHSGDNLVSRTVEQVVMRADEIMELLMCYQWRNPRSGMKKLGKLSHQIQVGLQAAFNKFDEYQFAKYNRGNLDVKLRDALFIVHPKAKNESQQQLFDKIAKESLETPYTWETELSALGSELIESQEARRESFARKWCELIESGRLGYMALMRNLRNILVADVDEQTLEKVALRISSLREVESAKQLPYRYLSAYKELVNVSSVNTSMLLDALERAAMLSINSLDGFSHETRVMIACDMSGSMQHSLSPNSKIMYYEVGNMLAMMLQSRCKKVVSGIFADSWKVVNHSHMSILGNTCSLSSRIGEVGYGTYGGKPLEWLINEKISMDKVMFFTDCQFYGESRFGEYFMNLWDNYKKIAPEAKLYLFDLAGYGHMPIEMPREDVVLIAGWSDRVFDMLAALENGGSVVEEIKKIEL